MRLITLRWFPEVLLMLVALMVNLQPLPAFAEKENFLKHPNRTEWEAGGFYEGSFEDGTTFQMNLPYPPPKSIDRAEWRPSAVAAAYWYPRRFSGKAIQLTTKSFGDGAFLLAIRTPGTEKIAEEELFEGAMSPDKTTAQGLWTLTRTKRKMSFTLKRLFVYKGIDVYLPSKEGKEDDAEHTFIFGATFPLTGNKDSDRWIRDLVTQCNHDQECSNSVEVVWLSKDLHSLHGSVWGYSHGMAHGQGYTEYRHYLTNTAKAASLDHFISTSESCSETISSKIIAALEKQGYGGSESAELGDGSHVKFLPTPTGILFAYDPYEVGTYAQGAPTVFIERQRLGRCLKYLPTHP